MHRARAKGKLLLLAISAVYASRLAPAAAASPEDALLIPGSLPLDTDGNLVSSAALRDQPCCTGHIETGASKSSRSLQNSPKPGVLAPCRTQVHAHGGGMLQDDNGTFYWFGESEKVFSLGVDFLSAGVNLYHSQDLATWQFGGLIFNSSAQIAGMPYEGPYRVERPKVLLCLNLHVT